MKPASALIFVIYACGCAGLAAESAKIRATTTPTFVGDSGEIAIDLGRLTVRVGSSVTSLEDCSSTTFYCFKNEVVGVHIVAPRLCRTPHRIEGMTAGGYRFYEISMVEHGDPRQGRYVSSLSARFAYNYYLERGIFEIQYDPAGQWQFGPRSNGNSAPRSQVQPHVYRLPPNQAFLRCR
jgi:hypothetical protein